jgi:hypothetical protein
MAQIATNFLLLAVYLSHIVGRSEDEARANPFHRMIAAKDGSFVEPGGS